MSSTAYTSLCGYCAERIGKTRDLEEASMEFLGRCSCCHSNAQLIRYDVGMTHAELERRRRARAAADKTKRVSGERGRAESRAR